MTETAVRNAVDLRKGNANVRGHAAETAKSRRTSQSRNKGEVKSSDNLSWIKGSEAFSI